MAVSPSTAAWGSVGGRGRGFLHQLSVPESRRRAVHVHFQIIAQRAQRAQRAQPSGWRPPCPRLPARHHPPIFVFQAQAVDALPVCCLPGPCCCRSTASSPLPRQKKASREGWCCCACARRRAAPPPPRRPCAWKHAMPTGGAGGGRLLVAFKDRHAARSCWPSPPLRACPTHALDCCSAP